MARPIDDIAQALTDAIIAAIKDREGELKSIAEAGGSKAGSGIFGDVGNLTDIVGTIVEIALLLDPPAEAAYQVVKTAEGSGGHLGRGFGIGSFLGYAAWQMMQPAVLPLQQKLNTVFQTQQMDPDVSARWVTQNILSLQDGRNKAHETNISDDHFDKWVDSLRLRPDVMTLLTMRNRDLINDDDMRTALQRHGYTDLWIQALTGLRRVLLSPADLALATLRGNVTDDVARSYVKQLGVSDDDFTVLIGNTGEPPGVMQMLEMFRRGFIDEDQLVKGIRESRVRNEWIEPVKKLRFEPMTTADAARAVVENYLTDEQGAAIAQLNGLEPDHWQYIVKSWGRPLSHEQMMTLYHRGEVTLDQVHQAFRESDLKDKYIDQAVELGRELIPQRTIVSMIDHGVIDHATGVELLLLHGYTREDADRLVKLGTAQRSTSHKSLSKTDILAMYTDALMNRQQAADHLTKLGYSSQDASEMLDLAEFKRKAQQLKVIERGIQASFRAHHLTAEQAMAELTHNGLDHTQAQILVDEWSQERKVVTRSLTEAQVVKFVNDLIMTPDDGRTRLHALGYSDTDIDLLYMDKGIIPARQAWTPPTTT